MSNYSINNYKTSFIIKVILFEDCWSSSLPEGGMIKLLVTFFSKYSRFIDLPIYKSQ